MNIKFPCLVYLGDVRDVKDAKTALGISEWRPERCTGQLRDSDDAVSVGLMDQTIDQSISSGAKTLLVGVALFETQLPRAMYATILEAIGKGMDIACGLHCKLSDIPEIAKAAALNDVQLVDFRHRTAAYPKGNGEKRSGKRILTVGNDCACGKKFTALSVHRALAETGTPCDFRSTGQTGFLISDSGINNDTIPADFLSGAAEWLSPAAPDCHWDIVEGQGAIYHPSFAAGSVSLLMGTQPDLIVYCIDPLRSKHRGTTKPLMDYASDINANLLMARRTNPNVKLAAISVMALSACGEQTLQELEALRDSFGVYMFDPSVPNDDFADFIKYIEHFPTS